MKYRISTLIGIGLILAAISGFVFNRIQSLRTVSPKLVLHPIMPAPPENFEIPANVMPEVKHYPLSLIYGGFDSVSEFEALVKRDPVLQSFYKGFDFSSAVMKSFDRDQLLFVSFRKGNQILWTRKPIFVRAGQRYITDGRMTILARCGNLVSAGEQYPQEDPALPLDRDISELEIPLRNDAGPSLARPLDVLPVPSTLPAIGGTAVYGYVPGPGFISIGGVNSSPVSNSVPTGAPPVILGTDSTPTTPTPEPETFGLVLIGLLVAISSLAIRRTRRAS